jgi:hypothetical protein
MTKGKKIHPGKPLEGRLEPSAIIRLLGKVIEGEQIPAGLSTPCWLWNAGKDKHGYGQIKWRGKARWAHRVSFEVFVGPIPAGEEVDHLCHCHSCINPEHLSVSSVTNNRRRQRRRRPAMAMADDEVAPF